MKARWDDIKQAIHNKWNVVSENEIVQSEGINELTSIISRKTGEPRPNVLHEVIHFIQDINSNHPILEDYFNNTMISGDNGSNLRDLDERENRV